MVAKRKGRLAKGRLAAWVGSLSIVALPALAAGFAATKQEQGAPPVRGPEQQAKQWDKVFSGEPHYRTEPNEFLGRMLKRLADEKWLEGGKALDLAMGDGRNALLLAERGFSVTGVDISPVALEKARAAAKAKNLALDAREADLATFDYGVAQWDVLSVLYFNPALDLVDKLKASVKPGGVVVIEGQGSEHEGSGPPPATRFKPNALLRMFADWRVMAYEDGRFESDWNPGPRTHVVRFMAMKPKAKPPPK